ncbi:MAG: LemA family protein [Planctomycetota bacterium]|jgi:LemA protein|nr:LemA family protein [Planctomycetota bacterium]
MVILIAIVVVVAVLAIAVLGYYNGFVAKRNLAAQAFSTIDVMLTKRADLVPNLVATVKEYMGYEAGTLTKITELRARALDRNLPADERVRANDDLGQGLRGLMVQLENYPQLKANENFLNLQHSLNEVEEQIAASRRTCNAAVTSYNTSLEMFPGSVVANWFSFGKKPLLEATERERVAPRVGDLFRS